MKIKLSLICLLTATLSLVNCAGKSNFSYTHGTGVYETAQYGEVRLYFSTDKKSYDKFVTTKYSGVDGKGMAGGDIPSGDYFVRFDVINNKIRNTFISKKKISFESDKEYEFEIVRDKNKQLNIVKDDLKMGYWTDESKYDKFELMKDK